MIGVRCTVKRGGEIVHDETTFFDEPTLTAVAKTMHIFHEPVEVMFAFDPPLVTEIPLGPDDDPDRSGA